MSDKPYRRRTYLIKSSFQLRYMGLIVVTMLTCSILTGWMIYYLSWSPIAQTPDLTLEKLAAVFDQVNRTLVWWIMGMAFMIALISIFVSHKIAGPVYRFEQATKIVANGDLTGEIHLRHGDELRELENDFNKMIISLRKIVAKDREIISGLIKIGDRIQKEIDNKTISRDELSKISTEIHQITVDLNSLTSGFKIEADSEGGLGENGLILV